MKKLLLIVFILLVLISCGPHRMSCGAKGICEIHTKSSKMIQKSVHLKDPLVIR